MQRLNHILHQLTPMETAAVSSSGNVNAPASSASSASVDIAAVSPVTLSAHLNSVLTSHGTATDTDQSLHQLLISLANATADISRLLRGMHVAAVGSSNEFGDKQLNVDVETHQCVLRHLEASGVCISASSEEDPRHIDLSHSLRPDVGRERHYNVTYDPLDGSSIIDANFSVGGIYAVWNGSEPIGQKVEDMVAAALAVFGPRTSIIFALPPNISFEVTLDVDGRSWLLTRPSIRLSTGPSKTFAPANLRCTQEDEAYNQLVNYYITKKYTLRYSGGLVPDVYHSLIKGQGIFLSPTSTKSPAKLRLVYEVAAVANVVRWSGGAARDQNGVEVQTIKISSYNQRSGLIAGSRAEVDRFNEYRQKYSSTKHSDA